MKTMKNSDLCFYREVLNHNDNSLSTLFVENIKPTVEHLTSLSNNNIRFRNRVIVQSGESIDLFSSMLAGELLKEGTSIIIDSDFFLNPDINLAKTQLSDWFYAIFTKANKGVGLTKKPHNSECDPVVKAVTSFISRGSFDSVNDNDLVIEFLFSEQRTQKLRSFASENNIDDKYFPLSLENVLNISSHVGFNTILKINTEMSCNPVLLDLVLNKISKGIIDSSLVEFTMKLDADLPKGFLNYNISSQHSYGKFNPFSSTINTIVTYSIFSNGIETRSVMDVLIDLSIEKNYEFSGELEEFLTDFEVLTTKKDPKIREVVISKDSLDSYLVIIINAFFDFLLNPERKELIFTYLFDSLSDDNLSSLNSDLGCANLININNYFNNSSSENELTSDAESEELPECESEDIDDFDEMEVDTYSDPFHIEPDLEVDIALDDDLFGDDADYDDTDYNEIDYDEDEDAISKSEDSKSKSQDSKGEGGAIFFSMFITFLIIWLFFVN